ncbi:hypothetical protein ASZ78_006992 [Callipepla squamata]|uniref:Uncharacterized protein n=1 Tax=Callipepla squamata TaxID=9009 RepID=A0A226MPQ5_CALSU|nr:hypothetical protein ASZ78_006992 [Callipepla squamata]
MAAAGSGAEAAAARLEGAGEEEETAAAAAGDGENEVVDGGGGGAAAATGGESEEEEEEDVFEVEKILDVKTEGKLSLNDDVFEAESDNDGRNETKGDVSPKKKKKKTKEGEDRSADDTKKKKSKSAKVKEKARTECESSSDTLGLDSKSKKRTSENKEDSKDPKKQKKEDTREVKKKKGEVKDVKIKTKEDSKESKKSRKEKQGDVATDSEQSAVDGALLQETDNESPGLHSENKEEEQQVKCEKEEVEEEIAEKDSVAERQLDGLASNEDESAEGKAKRKKKKNQKMEDYKEEGRKVEIKEGCLEKKSVLKKQKSQEKMKVVAAELEKVAAAPVSAQKALKVSAEEKGRKSTDSAEEEKEVKKTEMKEKPLKKESEKEEKSRREQKVLKSYKDTKSALDMFNVASEEKKECCENLCKREEPSLEYKFIEELKLKDSKVHKERRSIKDETETWNYVAAGGGREVVDVCQVENSDGKQQVLSLGMDMQLEWLTLEDFQKHLDGEDENHISTEPISNTLLRDAVKSGDYMTVKMALSSSEEYNLDQENFLTTVAILLEAGAYVNMQQSSGETALMKCHALIYLGFVARSPLLLLGQACKRGNSDIVRLMIESGADCNILSKHQNSALHFAKQCNNILVYEQLKSHLETLSRVAEDTIRDYFEARLVLLEPVFPIACHRLCEGPDFSTDFNYKPPQNVPEGSGILLFIFHANFFGKEVVARLCGPCSVQAVVLNDKFQLPVFLDSHFIYSFSPTAGLNKLFIRLAEAPTAKVQCQEGARQNAALFLLTDNYSSLERIRRTAKARTQDVSEDIHLELCIASSGVRMQKLF